MKPKLLITLFLLPLLMQSCNNEPLENDPEEQQDCDNGTFVGDVILNSQQEVNEFGILDYCIITGQLVISAPSGEPGCCESDITDLSSLSSLTSIGGSLKIMRNTSLTSLNGLENISDIGGSLWIRNSSITNLDPLINLSGEIQEIFILENEELINILGLSSISSPIISIGYNNSLTSLEGMENMVSLNEISIWQNSNLASLEGLSNLSSVNSLTIIENLSLTSLSALSSLENVDNDINIHSNNSIVVLDGLENLISIGGNLDIGKNTNNIDFDFGNDSLIDFCALENLFLNGTFGQVSIDHNAYNPTVQDIIDGNCSQ